MKKTTRRQMILLPGQALMAAAALAVTESGAEKPSHAFGGSGEQPPGRVYIVLWFDTEDYILPASDDAVKRIADFLTREGIRATFKVVGAKARALERRRRRDVIAALARHEIGYHSNTHSQHPTVAEYEAVLDWELGAEEFDRRERRGFNDLRRIFGRAPTCYGQPGDSWAPQVFPTLRKWGVPVYLDDGLHVGLDGKPFWYGSLLNIFNIHAGSHLRPNKDWSNLAEAKARFKALYSQLTAQSPGGLVSLYFHPTEFISREFWDEVNFAHGANPPRSEWKLQPERTPAERERAFQYLEGLVAYMKSLPDVQFVTATEAYTLYPDTAQGRVFDVHDVAQIAAQVHANVSFQVHNGYALSASEVFDLLNKFVSQESRRPIKL